ncbi:MAG: hypothetical protein IKC65_08735, partial [Lentisphaeria bacterium]|nr:hypothetical protein [Lentisphaeria bacterium]
MKANAEAGEANEEMKKPAVRKKSGTAARKKAEETPAAPEEKETVAPKKKTSARAKAAVPPPEEPAAEEIKETDVFDIEQESKYRRRSLHDIEPTLDDLAAIEADDDSDDADDDDIAADPTPTVKRKLVIKRVQAPPVKFLPKVTAETAASVRSRRAAAVSSQYVTKQEKESARKSALDSKLVVGTKNDT